MGQRFNPKPVPRFDQSLIPTINENFQQLVRLLANISTESISATAPDNPYQGQMWIDTTTFTIHVWTGSAWTGQAWTNYTGVVIQQGVTVTRTIVYCRYEKIGRRVKFQGYLSLTGSGTNLNSIIVSLPFTSATTGIPVGQFYWFDSSAGVNFIVPAAITGSATFIQGLLHTTGFVLGTLATDGVYNFPTQVASGDSILWDVEYESAT